MAQMIICVCRALNENKIAEAKAAGATCPNSVMRHHKTRFNCGQCKSEIGAIVADNSAHASHSKTNFGLRAK